MPTSENRELIDKTWKKIVRSSNELVKNYKKDDAKTKKDVKAFVDHLINLSECFVSHRFEVLGYLKDEYGKMFLQAVNLLSSADSVAVIMQANEGINDYLILVNVFRNLLVELDTMASAYWVKTGEINIENPDVLKVLVQKSNYAIFNKKEEEKIATPAKIKEDVFFNTIMNQSLWIEIKNLDEKYILKNQENFEYFKELLISTEDLANDMVINLWAVLAVAFSYVDYLNNLLKG